MASLDCSLAPGAHYPVPVRQGSAALRYLAAHAGRFGGDPARIVLGGDTGFPALRTYLWACTGVRDWASYPAISQLSTTRHVTSRYPPTFLTVGDADPFRFQAAELASALERHTVPVTTLFWNGTGDHLGHEYQFNFALPQARTAFQRTLRFLAAVTRG